MTTRCSFRIAFHVAIFAGCGLMIGCAAIVGPAASKKAARSAERRAREDDVFEQKRDEAQIVAARDRMEAGDPAAAEKLLKSLLERKPGHLEAHLLLADLCIAEDRPDDAETQLRAVLDKEPGNARAHHTLGLLDDVAGRDAEAARHFRRAVELAPQEELYRLSLEAVTPETAR